jgi:HAD superfamily hydrolase (TIGR01549 family)
MRPGPVRLLTPIFDLDGTLLDSDAALVAPFAALGIDPAAVTFGRLLADECADLGVSVDAYLDHYDADAAKPFAGVEEMLDGLTRWAVCSNKHPRSGAAELARLGWDPDVVLFADAFGGPKHLGPVLDDLGLGAGDVVFVGDTDHDRRCALDVGCRFVHAGWNVRAVAGAGDLVARHPSDIPRFLVP